MIIYINGKRVSVTTTFGSELSIHCGASNKSTVSLIVENWDSSTDRVIYSVDGGEAITISTLSFQVEKGSEVAITVKKSGYFDWTQTVTVEESSLEITPVLEEIHTIDESIITDNFNYEMVGNVARLTTYNGESTTVVIPNV